MVVHNEMGVPAITARHAGYTFDYARLDGGWKLTIYDRDCRALVQMKARELGDVGGLADRAGWALAWLQASQG